MGDEPGTAAAVFALRTQAIHHRAQATLHNGLARATDAMADRVEMGEQLDPQAFNLKLVVGPPEAEEAAPEFGGFDEAVKLAILEAMVARVEGGQLCDTEGISADTGIREDLMVKYLQRLQDDNYVTRRAGKGNEWFITSKARQSVSVAQVER